MDAQPDSPLLQHFKRQGPISVWFILVQMSWIYYAINFLYQHYTDAEYFKKPRPPPLDHPNDTTTPDTSSVKAKKTKEYRYLLDSGHLSPIRVDIVDGKKVFDKWAGVNQPMEFI